MNRAILISIASAASLAAAVATPTLAQTYNYHGYYQGSPGYQGYPNYQGYQGYQGDDQTRPYGGISHRLDYLSSRIDAAQQGGSINWREAQRLRGVLAQVRGQEQSYLAQGSGLNQWQRDRLNQRLDDVAGELRN